MRSSTPPARLRGAPNGDEPRVRAVVVDDDPAFRGIMTMILQQRPTLDVVGQAGTVAEARQLCARVQPDFALIDRQLGADDGVALGESLKKIHPGLKMLLLTAFPTDDLPARLLAAGFLGYVDKDAAIERIVQAVEAVASGHFFFASRVAPAKSTPSNAPFAPAVEIDTTEAERLAPRQREIAAMVARGMMSKEIAAELQLSLRTVEKHRGAILRRLGLRDTASLTRWCLKAGLIR